MGGFNETTHEAKKKEIMVHSFECYAEHGLGSANIRDLAKASGISSGNLYTYFDDLDDLIIQSTEFNMSRVEDEFMERAPKTIDELWKFIDEIPYWTAKTHGKKYRLMYQIYTHPKYIEYGKKFFEGVNKRYTDYAASLADRVKIPKEKLTPLIFILIRACVHFALFEDEFYLKSQMSVLRETLEYFIREYNK